MPRALSVCAVLFVLPFVVRADDQPTETVVRLTISPAPDTRPALKYQLLPPLSEVNQGNAIQEYLRSFMEQNHFFHSKDAVEEREKWQTIPLKDLPLDKVRHYGGIALRQVDYAARMSIADWQIIPRAQKEGVNLLIPDVQVLRSLAAALKVRFRGEVADRRFDDAVRTARTMLAMSRHLSEHPTVIADLVGIACANVALGPLEEMIEQPGSPNLYWPLSFLPQPLVSLHQGLKGEQLLMLHNELGPPLGDSRVMTEPELAVVVQRLMEMEKAIGGLEGLEKVQVWLPAQSLNLKYLADARKALVELGLPSDRVAKFPPVQLILLNERYQFESMRDEVIKSMMMPYWQAEPVLRASEQELRRRVEGHLLLRMVPALVKVRQAEGRLEQRLALLRHVEALRMYAAENGGKLPAQLTDVKVPLPVDPFTGKPFGYKVEGNKAFLQGTPPKGAENNYTYKVRYEVTLRK
jgi:hypothetical protein